jgi:membrane protein implicated in regulation of membrane protease activity
MNFVFTWIAIALVFVIIEFISATFYGLALSIAALIVAVYVYIVWDTEFTVIQGLIFAVTSLIFAYTLPKVLTSSSPDVPQGFDKYIGEKRTVKKIAWDLKISLDGVEYTIDTDEEISAGDKVEVIGHKGTGMKVKKVK